MMFRIPQTNEQAPVPSLGGGVARRRPLIPFTIINPSNQRLVTRYALLDPGVDDILLPISLAVFLGINLTAGPHGRCFGLPTLPALAVAYAAVELELTDAQEGFRWSATVAFTANGSIRYPVFGVAGGLEHFHTTIDFVERQVSLVPRRMPAGARHTVA